MKKYKITLTASEIEFLEQLTRNNKRSARIIRNAYVLLDANEGPHGKKMKDEAIAEALGITTRTIEHIRKKFVLEGFDTALYGRKSSRVYGSKVDGEVEAHLIALSCSTPPQGFARWSLRLLSDKMVALKYIDSISHETIRTVLKKRVKALERKGLVDLPPEQ